MEKTNKITRDVMFVISLCFFLSGMCGLIYQVLWTKMLGLVFGHTAFAATTVVGTFLGGLALGSFLMGRSSDRGNWLLKKMEKFSGSTYIATYCILEIGVGIFCFLTPYLFQIAEVIYLRFSDLSLPAITLIRFILCAIVMLPPTMAMGATLPLISKFLIQKKEEIGTKLGFIYFINTIGSAIGAFLAGFYLIPFVGVSSTLHVAAVLNIGIGLFLQSFNRGLESDNITEDKGNIIDETVMKEKNSKNSQNNPQKTKTDKIIVIFSILFAASGFASLAYELAWNRALALSLGSSTYAFSAMLTTFLLGTALGSFIFSKWSKNKIPTLTHFAVVQTAIGISSTAFIPIFGQLPIIFGEFLPYIRNSYNLIITFDFLLCFFVMIIPVTFIGISFPMAGNIYARHLESLGKSIGDIYAINTIGSVSGSILTGFLLMPMIGIQNTISLAVTINLVAALILLLLSSSKKEVKIASSFLILFAIIAVFNIPQWDKRILTGGFFRGKSQYNESITDGEKLLYYKDGISSTVSVKDHGSGHISLAVNGKIDASIGKDMGTQVLLAALPAIYHPNPRTALVIGLGSGTTLATIASLSSIDKAECIELEPAVIEGAKFFIPYTGDIYHNPKCEIKIADGRNYMMASPKTYDLIISEPSNPWVAGVASLFTENYFHLCKSKLTEEGIACIWLQHYAIDADNLKMILNTIYKVFPYIQIWSTPQEGDFLIICGKNPLKVHYASYENQFQTNTHFKNLMNQAMIQKPESLLLYYITSIEKATNFLYLAKTNTDDKPILEFSAPKQLYIDTKQDNYNGMIQYKDDDTPPMTKNINLSEAYYMEGVDILQRLSNQSSNDNFFLKKGLQRYPSEPMLQLLKLNSESRFYKEKALQQMKTITEQYPKNTKCLAFYAEILEKERRYEECESIYSMLSKHEPENLDHKNMYAFCLSKNGKYEKILAFTERNAPIPQEKNRDYKEKLRILSPLLALRFKALIVLNKIQEAGQLAQHLVSIPAPEIQHDLARYYLDTEQYEKAVFPAKHYYMLSKRNIDGILLYAEALEKNNQLTEAAAVAAGGLSDSPYNQSLLRIVKKGADFQNEKRR